MVGYTGNYWYVSPVVNNHYPPDNPIAPINFGLFYLCYRGHCKYDLRQDYQIVLLIPEELGEFDVHSQLLDLFRTWVSSTRPAKTLCVPRDTYVCQKFVNIFIMKIV